MTRQTAVVVGLGAVALVVASVFASPTDKTPKADVTMQAIDPSVAAKAEASCWFKVKSRSGKAAEVRQWASATPAGVRTERLGELLIVTGAMEPAVHDDRFFGCSLFEYTKGSPVVMSAISSPAPVRPDTVVPFGFSKNGIKELR